MVYVWNVECGLGTVGRGSCGFEGRIGPGIEMGKATLEEKGNGRVFIRGEYEQDYGKARELIGGGSGRCAKGPRGSGVVAMTNRGRHGYVMVGSLPAGERSPPLLYAQGGIIGLQEGKEDKEGRRAGGQEGKEGSVVPADVLSGSPLWEFSLIRSRVSGNFDPWGLMEVCPYCTKIHGSAHGSGHGSVQGRRGAPAPSMLHTWWLVGGYNDHLLELRRGCGLAGRADIKTPTPVAIQACASCLMPKFPRVGG